MNTYAMIMWRLRAEHCSYVQVMQMNKHATLAVISKLLLSQSL